MCPQYPICYRVMTPNKIVRSVKIDVGKFSSPVTNLASFPESSFCHTTEISLTPASLAPFFFFLLSKEHEMLTAFCTALGIYLYCLT